mmetsp:Transcript_3787/g.12048  ORF Transcript_3787/g.12048 Transcript_3787/m.12048 type:complete len:390 (+) Transcript_3787:2355-3524(+)
MPVELVKLGVVDFRQGEVANLRCACRPGQQRAPVARELGPQQPVGVVPAFVAGVERHKAEDVEATAAVRDDVVHKVRVGDLEEEVAAQADIHPQGNRSIAVVVQVFLDGAVVECDVCVNERRVCQRPRRELSMPLHVIEGSLLLHDNSRTLAEGKAAAAPFPTREVVALEDAITEAEARSRVVHEEHELHSAALRGRVAVPTAAPEGDVYVLQRRQHGGVRGRPIGVVVGVELVHYGHAPGPAAMHKAAVAAFAPITNGRPPNAPGPQHGGVGMRLVDAGAVHEDQPLHGNLHAAGNQHVHRRACVPTVHGRAAPIGGDGHGPLYGHVGVLARCWLVGATGDDHFSSPGADALGNAPAGARPRAAARGVLALRAVHVREVVGVGPRSHA